MKLVNKFESVIKAERVLLAELNVLYIEEHKSNIKKLVSKGWRPYIIYNKNNITRTVLVSTVKSWTAVWAWPFSARNWKSLSPHSWLQAILTCKDLYRSLPKPTTAKPFLHHWINWELSSSVILKAANVKRYFKTKHI